MALNNYSDLKTTVANYLARSDLTSVIPDFIQLAEQRLRRELRIRQPQGQQRPESGRGERRENR